MRSDGPPPPATGELQIDARVGFTIDVSSPPMPSQYASPEQVCVALWPNPRVWCEPEQIERLIALLREARDNLIARRAAARRG